MSVFTSKEIEYLQGQALGRLATVNAAGEHHVVPVSFRHNAELETIDIGGHNLGRSKKFRGVSQNERATFVVDNVLPPWRGSRCAGTRRPSPREGGKSTRTSVRSLSESRRRGS